MHQFTQTAEEVLSYTEGIYLPHCLSLPNINVQYWQVLRF